MDLSEFVRQDSILQREGCDLVWWLYLKEWLTKFGGREIFLIFYKGFIFFLWLFFSNFVFWAGKWYLNFLNLYNFRRWLKFNGIVHIYFVSDTYIMLKISPQFKFRQSLTVSSPNLPQLFWLWPRLLYQTELSISVIWNIYR